MTNATLRGKPDAGNPHVRFDEGEVAPGNPRRGSLLYSTLHDFTIRAGMGILFASQCLLSGAENVTTAEDKTASGDWEVTVLAGATNYVTVVQSGTGKIVKKGGGNLVLSAENTFSGGVVIDEGIVEPADSSAFGTGKVTLNANGTKVCQVRFTKGELTFANALEVVGNTAIGQPALYFAAGTNVWNGAISAANDLYMLDDGAWAYISTGGTITWNGSAWVCSGSKWSEKVKPLPIMTFNGTLSAPNGLVYLLPSGTFKFNEKITCSVFDSVYRSGYSTCQGTSDIGYYGDISFCHENAIGELCLGYRSPVAGVTGALDGTHVNWTKYDSSANRESGNLTASGGTIQKVVAFTTLELPSNRTCCNLLGASSANPAQYLVTGKGLAENTTKESWMRIGRNESTTRYLNFAISGDKDVQGFTQILHNRLHRMIGAVGVTNGTLRLENATAFSNVTAVAVGTGGKLECNSSIAKVFYGAKSLSLAGELEVATGREWPFSANLTSLALESGAKLTMPSDMNAVTVTVTSITINGTAHQCGLVSSAELTAAGITVSGKLTLAASGVLATTAAATWTGAAEADDLMTTADNWSVTKGTLNVANGMLAATVAADATNMVPGEGRTFIGSITRTSPTFSTDLKPFFLGAKDKKFEIVGSAKFNAPGQVVLRGEIVPPDGISDQGSPAKNGDTTFTFTANDAGHDNTYPSACYCGYYAYAIPLVLDGVTMGKPYYSRYGANAGDCVLYTTANSANIFTGAAYFSASAWTEWTLSEGSTVDFRGGVESDSRICKRGPGVVKITGKPWSTGVNGFTVVQGGIILDAEGCDFGDTNVGKGLDLRDDTVGGNCVASAEFKRSYCFKGITHQMEVTGSGCKTVEFNCTTQRVAQFYGAATAAGSCLRGTYPAMLEIYGGCRKGGSLTGCAGMTNMIQVTGGLGFHMVGTGVNNGVSEVANGANSTFVLKGKDFESIGDLEVSGGTLLIENGATWRCGTNVTVRGTGTLTFNGSRQLNGEFACLHLADSGQINLAGGWLHVASAEVFVDNEWQEVPPGNYTQGSTGLMVGRITGTHTLRVGAMGTKLIVK